MYFPAKSYIFGYIPFVIVLMLAACTGPTQIGDRATNGMNEEEMNIEQYIEGSVEALSLQTETHDATFGFRQAQDWAVDQDTGKVTWTFTDGKVVTADVQIIGSYNPADGTFLWGWDHPSVVSDLQEHAKLVKDFGLEHGIDEFTTQTISISTEDEAWEFVAVANRLANANGGYRGDAGGPVVFMTFGEVTLSKP